MERWTPRVEQTKKEQLIMKRLGRVRALFGFLRAKRRDIFNDAFQDQLEEMYRQTGAGECRRSHGSADLGGVLPTVGGARNDPHGEGTGGCRRCLVRRDGGDGDALCVGLDAGLDGGVIATEEARDLGEAEVALGVVADPPPDLVAGAGDALRASATAELGKWHATSGGHIEGDRIEVAFS
jgi:hypothetical protein